MRIFNQNKTIELNQNNIDLSKGYLANDKLFIQHHNPIQAKIIKFANDIAQEYRAKGKEVNLRDDGYYVTTEYFPKTGGRIEDKIEDIIEEAQEAYDEYEDIQVYIPYTEQELKNVLRSKREKLLSAFDKWEKAVLRGREQDDYTIMSWYQSLLNLNEIAFEVIPDRIKYYL